MKKGLMSLLVGLMVMGASATAFASARIDSLAADWRLMEDYDLIWLYPNKVTEYKNTVDLRMPNVSSASPFTTGGSEWGGFLDGLHPDLGVIGAYVYRPKGFDGNGNQIYWGEMGWNGVGGGNFARNGTGWSFSRDLDGYVQTPENKVDLFWGKTFDKSNFGVQINYADAQPSTGSPLGYGSNDTFTTDLSTATDKSQTATNNSRSLGIRLGLGISSDFFEQANFHLGYDMGTVNVTEKNDPNTAVSTVTNNDSLKDDGIYTISLGTLLQHDLDQDSNIRMFADAYLDQNNLKQSETTANTSAGLHQNAADIDIEASSKYSQTTIQAGVGCNHKVLDGKALINSGLVIGYQSWDYKSSETTQNGTATSTTPVDLSTDEHSGDWWEVVWNASVEAKVASWLTVRAGVNKPIIDRYQNIYTNNYNYSGNTAQNTNKTTNGYYDGWTGAVNMAYGISVNWENWVLDATVDTGSFESSISNVQPGNGLLFTNGNSIANLTEVDLKYKI